MKYILHTASPYTFNFKDGEEELLKPAINGTLNVLKAAKGEGVQKVVITSSFAAITNSKAGGAWRDYTYTERGKPYRFEPSLYPKLTGISIRTGRLEPHYL